MSIHAIAAHNVSVALDGRWLLRDINVVLRAACLTVFIGPNGSGKTTLLRVLAGLLGRVCKLCSELYLSWDE